MTPRIPLNSLSRHIAPLQQQLATIAEKVIQSGHYVLGPAVQSFEAEFAAYCGVRHCAGVGNGTDALELALRAAGVRAGDKVAVVANAAMYSATAALAIGAVPVFVDVGEDANMDPDSLSNAVAVGLSAVVITHLYGRLADAEALAEVARQARVPVIEDCAQAHGARDAAGRAAGSLADVAAFSFYPTKNLGAIGDGGAVVTDNPAIAENVRKLRQYGWGGKYRNELPGGRNSRLDELQAAFLSVMLPHLDAWNERRREIANFYSANIENPAITVPRPGGAEYVGHLYVVRTERRDALRKHLDACGIDTDIHYPIPDHHQPCFGGAFKSVRLESTERLAATALTLPCFPELLDSEVEQVVQACSRF